MKFSGVVLSYEQFLSVITCFYFNSENGLRLIWAKEPGEVYSVVLRSLKGFSNWCYAVGRVCKKVMHFNGLMKQTIEWAYGDTDTLSHQLNKSMKEAGGLASQFVQIYKATGCDFSLSCAQKCPWQTAINSCAASAKINLNRNTKFCRGLHCWNWIMEYQLYIVWTEKKRKEKKSQFQHTL